MSEPPPPGTEKKPGGRKKLMMLLLPLLLAGAGAGGWFSGVIPKLLGKTEAATEAAGHAAKNGAEAGKEHADGKADGKPPIFMDLPDIVANLNTGNRRAAFVKLKAKLELSRPEDQATIVAAMPRVLDLFQGYLREMRPEELRGSASTYRLREELLARTNLAAPPVRVAAVLFTEIIVQ